MALSAGWENRPFVAHPLRSSGKGGDFVEPFAVYTCTPLRSEKPPAFAEKHKGWATKPRLAREWSLRWGAKAGLHVLAVRSVQVLGEREGSCVKKPYALGLILTRCARRVDRGSKRSTISPCTIARLEAR